MRFTTVVIALFCISSLHAQTPTITSIVDSAVGDSRLAPGDLATINGTNLGTSTSIPVTVGGKAAAVLSAPGTQLKIQIPVDAAIGNTTVVVGASAPFSTVLFDYAPKFLSVDGTGHGTVMAFHGIFGAPVTTADPAIPGTTVTILAIGLGPTNPVVPTGATAPNGPFANTTVAPTLSVGGQPATIQFTELRPGFIGTYQITIGVPNAASGDQNVGMTIAGAGAGSVTLPVGAPPANGPSITSVVETASSTNRLAPGSLAFVNGTNLGTSTAVAVTVAGKAAFVLNASPAQLRILIPTAAPTGNAAVVVGNSQPFNINLTQYAPVLISADGSGKGNIRALHAKDGTPVTAASPASANESIMIYAIGLGPTNPPVADGTPPPPSPPSVTTQNPGASVGGQVVSVQVAALAQGQIGVYQITFTMRADATAGNPTFTMSIPSGVNSAGPTPSLTLPVGAPAIAGPTVSSVVNSASNALPGLPNAGVAPGSIFVAYGTGLGPTQLAVAPGYPWLPTLSGTSAKVTIRGQSVDMLLYYTSATQIAGLLPSSTPAGTGTIVVTYNGTPGPPGPITVVQNNLGVYTVSQNGAGPGIVTFADYSLVSGTKAANPGETLIIWATGLGPVSGNEAAGALPGDMPDIPVKVWVGGVAATVVYRGRSGCCVGEDQIAFVVPAGVVDCNASLVIQINNQISNNSTMAIAASGRTCIPALAGESVEILNKSPLSLGFIGVFRESFPATPGGPATKSDGADGNFLKASATGAQISATLGTVPLGSCQVTTSTFTPGSQGSHKDEPGFSFSLLDAGAALTLTGPSGTRTLSKSKDGGFRGQLGDGSPGNFLDPGNYTLTGPGGADVGKFTASITLPQPLVWTNQASLATVTRANGVTVNWTGDPKGTVEINGDSSFITGGGTGIGVNAAFKCLALAASGTFTVPAYVLLSLPPQFGNLTLGGIAPSASFTATGLDAGLFSAGSSNTISVTYR